MLYPSIKFLLPYHVKGRLAILILLEGVRPAVQQEGDHVLMTIITGLFIAKGEGG